MKLAEFNALCAREWEKPRRGDIESLRLTKAGRTELVNDAIKGHAYDRFLLRIEQTELAAISAGAGISSVVNPITRTVVKIYTKENAVRETARVRVMGGTYRSTWWPASVPAGQYVP